VTISRTPRNLARIERLLEEHSGLAPRFEAGELNAWRERARLAIAAVYGDPSPSLERFDEIRYSPSVAWSGMDRSIYDNTRIGGAKSAASQLRAVAEDLREHLGGAELPAISAAALHPWVAEAAGRLWADGHRREAVQTAATAVENWLRAKLGLHEGSAASLVASAFSAKPAAARSPRLRVPEVRPVGSDAWKNAHEGAGAFGRGCFMRIRNLYTHNQGQDEQSDLEALAALSLLARWIDAARVERGDT
jgi:hypothetical protein